MWSATIFHEGTYQDRTIAVKIAGRGANHGMGVAAGGDHGQEDDGQDNNGQDKRQDAGHAGADSAGSERHRTSDPPEIEGQAALKADVRRQPS